MFETEPQATLAELVFRRLLFLDDAIDGRIGIALHVPVPMPVPHLSPETPTITGHTRPRATLLTTMQS